MEEEDWQVICEHSLFVNRLHQLEEICHSQYNGVATDFIDHYLRPVVELLDTIRSKCEDYYQLKTKKEPGPVWWEKFEHIVKFAIHPKVISTTLHKGDFYIHISSTIPRTLELKYYHVGEVSTRTLSMTDCILMCSENWTELLRSEARDRFIYTSCVIWSTKGFERVLWVNLLKAQFIGNMNDSSTCIPSEKDNVLSKDTLNMDELSIKPMLILDLNFELLHSQVVYTPGSRDKRGGSVIFFDTNKRSWENTDLNSEELAKLLIYYYKIPKDGVQRKGCSLVIDAREGKQTRDILECIGEAVTVLQTQIPGSVHMAFVLTRKDSLMLLFAASKVKQNLNFQFQFLSSLEKLSREVDVEQLPECFGGQMRYNHDSWIKFRTKVEPFMTGCRSAAKHAMNYMQDLSRTDLGSTSSECQHLLDAHREKSREVLEDSRLLGLRTEGKQIIERLVEEDRELCRSEDYKDTIECLNRLYTQMTRVFDKLRIISDKRTKNLQLCLNVRTFEESCVGLIQWMHNDGYSYFEKHKEIGDSLGHAQSMMEEFAKFAITAEEQLSNGEECMLAGKYLIELDELQIDRDVLIGKLHELQNELNDFTAKYNERKKKLKKCVDFHTLVQEATQWWMSGLQYIAHMSMEEIQTLDGIHRLHASITNFKQNNPPISESQIAKITDLAHHLSSKQVEQAEQVSSRTLEVQEMLQVKMNQILGAEGRFRQVQLDSVMSDGDGDGDSSGFKDDDLSTEPDEDEYREQTDVEYAESLTSPIENAVGPIFSWKDGHKLYDENDAKLAVFDVAMPTKMKERLRHIIDEMINTEHEYVKSLEYILEHYLPLMESTQLPPTLIGQKNVIFGNIERICDFHKRFFSQEVEAFRHAPLQIGKCFLKWERQFYLYALYNKNKPRSDQLWNDFANNYFRKKMLELKDKLDLASYLIKPVQRLGKYSLLLRDMISCCDAQDPRVIEMETAHDLMKFQLRHGNDLLAMDAIQHSDVNLKEQGCLLRQGDFIVSYGKRKRSRRVFLFEHLLVFTKPKKQKAKGDVFTYKHSIKMVDIGLTENIGDSGLRFEVWYRRWKKGRAGETFVLQAVSNHVKISWTTDITRILWRQASRNKEYGLTEATTGISVESTPSTIFLDNSFNPSSSSFTRSRTMDLSPRGDFPANAKRLSWLSAGESSGSSGVFDLGSLPEDSQHPLSPRDEARFFKRGGEPDVKYSSLPRKKLTHHASFTRGETFDTISMVQLRRDQSVTHDSSFIRNNVYRKTLQAESTKRTSHKKVRRDSGSGGRFATQPIILPSSLSFTEGIPMGTNSLPRTHKFKKVSDRPTSPAQCIREVSEEDILDGNRRHFDSENITITKSATDSKIDYRTEQRLLQRPLRRSLTDTNIRVSNDLCYTSSLKGKSSNSNSNKEAMTLPIRKYSFTKAMVDSNTITVDEIEKERKLARQRSVSHGDSSLHMLGTKDSPTSPPAKSPGTNRNPFLNLKTKISKSLSEI